MVLILGTLYYFMVLILVRNPLLFYGAHDKYEFLTINSQIMSVQFSWHHAIIVIFRLLLFHAVAPKLKQIQSNSPQRFIQRKSPYKSQTA